MNIEEPVAWWDGKDLFFKEKHFDQLMPLYEKPQTKPLSDEKIIEELRMKLINALFEIEYIKFSQRYDPKKHGAEE